MQAEFPLSTLSHFHEYANETLKLSTKLKSSCHSGYLSSITVHLPPLNITCNPVNIASFQIAHVPPAAILLAPRYSSHIPIIKKARPKHVKIETVAGKELTLPTIIALDTVAAVITSLAVAPTVAIIDKAIVAHASGVQQLGKGVADGFREFFARPYTFIKQPGVLLVALVYAGTFGSANVADSVCQQMNKPSAMPKFFVSSTANLGLSLWKDRAFTVWYSAIPPRRVPVATYGLYAFRDALTMAASFSLPPILGEIAEKHLNRANNDSKSFHITRAHADFGAQLFLPCAMQFVTTPIHLAAIDLYTRPSGSVGKGIDAWKSRFGIITKDYMKNVTTRMFRILPAFGLGGNMNRGLKNSLKESAKKIMNQRQMTNATINVGAI